MRFDARGRHEDDPCDDVYQAALTMMPYGVWTVSPGHEQLYRGQRDTRWPVIASFFRVGDAARGEYLAHVNALACALIARRPGLSNDQAVALIQHHSAELGAPTWLLDLTWDPAVALLFASMGGVDGDIGVVTMFVAHEWDVLSARGRNAFGTIRVIEVPNVARIQRQRALFLDASHPDLIEQYVGAAIWFRQVDGLAFEAPEADWPVTHESCFPDRDPTLELVKRLDAKPCVEGRSLVSPALDATRPLDADDYLAIALSWCQEDGVELRPAYQEVLLAVSRVYSALIAERDSLGLTLRSIHRLRNAVEQIAHYQESGWPIDVETALEDLISAATAPTDRAVLGRLLPGPPGDIRSDW